MKQALDPHIMQKDRISKVIETFNERTLKSKLMAEKNRRFLADKSSIGLAFTQEIKEACYPIVADSAEGAYLWDIDGNKYTDILNGLGTHLFGHNPKFIQSELQEKVKQGFLIGAQSSIAGETAELFCKLTNMERITFSNTGTEAVMTALRIARHVTKRDTVAIFSNSYHGHSDQTLMRISQFEHLRRRGLQIGKHNKWLKALRPLLDNFMLAKARPAISGTPHLTAKNVLMLEYNNPKSLKLISSHRHRLAAVLVEPVQSRCLEIRPREFLHSLRNITQKNGIKLIFDEMVTGFRIHPGGAQAYFDVQADLVTYSKIAGGGLPLSIIAGRHGIMDCIDGGQWKFGNNSSPSPDTTFFAGTFCRHPLALITANACAKYLLKSGPQLQKELNNKTAELVERLNLYCEKNKFPISFTHFGSFFAMNISRSKINQRSINIFSFLLLNQGIHLRGGDKGGFLSTAHSKKDIDYIYTSFCKAFDNLADMKLISLLRTTY